MCIHERTHTPEFIKLASELKAKYNLEAITLVGRNGSEFSMFVNKDEPECIRRAAHDLRTRHPDAVGFSDQSAERLLGRWCSGSDLDDLPMIGGRYVPDSLDLDETNTKSVYERCLNNGYVHANLDAPSQLATSAMSAVNFSANLGATSLGQQFSPGPRVTKEQIEGLISAEYFTTADKAFAGAPTLEQMSLLTICVLVLKNGFTILGKSACAAPENFDADIGMKIAREDAIDQVWQLEGYLLKQRLWLNSGPLAGESPSNV